MAKEKVLKTVEKSVTIEASKTHTPKEFFQDREGLWVGSSFESRVLGNAETTPPDTKLKVSSYVLEKDATDEEIEKDLPKAHIFSESEVCAVVATLIEKQSKGEEGYLLNTGDWNLFYTASCVVSVYWHSDVREWSVLAWGRGGSGWSADSRVFFPVN